MVKPIRTKDSFQLTDSTLKEIYKTSLFDFSCLLCIALNDEFLSRNIFDLSSRELDRLKNTLKKTAEILKKYSFLGDLQKLAEEKLGIIKKIEPSIKKHKGRNIGERSKLILLWTQLLLKKRIISTGIFYQEEKKKIIAEAQGIIEEKDWIIYYGLLKWFHSKLENCSYASYLKLKKPNQQEEIKYLKSLWQKSYKNYLLFYMCIISF